MVMKALVAHDANDPLIPGVLAFFHATKRGDRWDSTKDTACVLYALCDYLAAVRAGPAAAGLVKVSVNGGEPRQREARWPGVEGRQVRRQDLKPGENDVHDDRAGRDRRRARPGGGVVHPRPDRPTSRPATTA